MSGRGRRWKSRLTELCQLAEENRNNSIGEDARTQITAILNRRPSAQFMTCVKILAERDVILNDAALRRGVLTEFEKRVH